ncbi:hypothetical protein [Nannocystis pusilla]|uniref:hypothetical protein n=1 Tax=Nannocystis pusilla TaxID=889268 RepID=UPI003DA5DF61
MLDTFNAEPRWRIAQLRGRPNGWALVVYPEGHDPDDAVAAIDIIMEKVDDVRWLDASVSQAEQDAILERLDRAMWAAFEARQEEEGTSGGEDDEDEQVEIPSPIQGLIEAMERRSRSLGADVASSKNLARSDGYQEIARALHDLADAPGISAEELQNWLESEHLMDAGEVVARSKVEAVPVQRLMRDLWDRILDALERR